jgi:hypothetical protein
MSGPERDDFEHVLAIWRAGYFNAKRSVLVLNEHLVAGGRTTQGAFNTIINDPGYDAMLEDGVVSVFMPRLPCMAEMRRAGLSFLDAINGKPGLDGKPLDPVRQFMVKTWHNKMLGQFTQAGAVEWLP